MIIATAGHVDHGKTTLVRALTGVDTDRLEEEKRRGMSIDIGFAYVETDDGGVLGFVDVPGHERFVRNMLAGVAAVDFALLVIAADDGPMPQTVEHLAILEQLGILQGAVALTKIDRVTPARQAEAAREIAGLLAASRLRGMPVFPVAAATGEGLHALRAHLETANQALTVRAATGNFRMAVDRAFSLPGAGLVVTGAVISGSVAADDELLISPAGIPVRVRGIHANNHAATAAHAGQRCALNLAGQDLKRTPVARGDWIVDASAHAPTSRFDARLSVLPGEPRALADDVMLHLHVGAMVTNARVALLDQRSLAPGAAGLVRLVTDKPVCVAANDRFIVRDPAAHRTVGGGHVIDPFPPARGRARAQRLAELRAADQPDATRALAALLTLTEAAIDLDRFRRTWNLTRTQLTQLLDALPVRFVSEEEATWIMSHQRWEVLRQRLLATLGAWHGRHPDAIGLAEAKLIAAAGPRTAGLRAALRRLLDERAIVRDGLLLRLPDHVPVLAEQDAALLERIRAVLQTAGLRPPIVGELAQQSGMSPGAMTHFLERVSELGHLVRVAKNRFFLPETIEALKNIAAELTHETAGQGDGASAGFDAAQYRDRSGIGRNLTIEVLEFLDKIGATRFINGRRTILR